MVFKNGNLFAYDEYGKKLWQTGAKANQFNVLKMLDTGKLAVLSSQGQELWTSK